MGFSHDRAGSIGIGISPLKIIDETIFPRQPKKLRPLNEVIAFPILSVG